MYVRQLDNGHWQASVTVRGQRRSATRRLKRDALKAGTALEIEMTRGDVEHAWRSDLTVGAACELQMRLGGYAPTLAAEYRRAVDRIPVDLARARLAEIDVTDVEAAYRQLKAKGVKPYGIRRVHELLRATFREARRVGVVESSPMDAVRVPAKPVRDVHPPTPEQVRQLLAAAPPGPVLIAVTLAAYTAMRRGEIVALRWDQVDLELGRITINRSLAYAPWAGVHDRPTKTGIKGHRTVSIDDQVVATLKAWRAEQCTSALANGLGSPTFVVTDLGGQGTWRPDRLTREFIATAKAAKVKGVRLHDLRHFIPTQLLSRGVAPSRVAAMLGHTSTATTERIYRHWIPGEDADLADLLGSIIRGG